MIDPESTVYLRRTHNGRYIANDSAGQQEVVYVPKTLKRKRGATITDEIAFLRSLAERKQQRHQPWTLGWALLMGFLLGMSALVAIVWLVLALGMV